MPLPNKYSDLSAEDIIEGLILSSKLDGYDDVSTITEETTSLKHELLMRFKKLETENKNLRKNYHDLGWKVNQQY